MGTNGDGSGGGVATRDISDTADPIFEVLDVVAEVADTSVMSLPPLYLHIDPEAIIRVVKTGSEDTSLTFLYDGIEVRIYGDGTVECELV